MAMSQVNQTWKQKFKQLFKSEQKTELRPQSPWRRCEQIVQKKLPKFDKRTSLEIPLREPEVVNLILARAPRTEVPAILCKMINGIDEDRNKGKRLVREVLVKRTCNNPFLNEEIECFLTSMIQTTATPAGGD